MNFYSFAFRNIWDKIKKSTTNPATFWFYFNTYILSKFENHYPDVYIVSYPKCGRTWIRIVLNNYLELAGKTSKTFKDPSILQVSDQSLIKFEHDKGNWVPAPPPPDKMDIDLNKFQQKKIVFLIRDPRDVLVSSWYHLKYRENIYTKELSPFIREPLTGINKIIKFFNQWIAHKDYFNNFIYLAYEDFHEAPYETFYNLFSFCGLDIDKNKLQEAIEGGDFKEMKKMESSGSLKEPWMKPGQKNSKNSMKIRKGKTGSYKQEMTPEDIQYINQQMKESLHPLLKSLYLESKD